MIPFHQSSNDILGGLDIEIYRELLGLRVLDRYLRVHLESPGGVEITSVT
jgi:hypothetical protein